MDISKYYAIPGEKPLDNIKPDGGFFGIFRKVAVIGDSLSSGEMESLNEKEEKGYHDYFEYSWGQYMARAAGCEVLNFSRGGMTASEYIESFADTNNFFDPAKACQAYIIALGINDLTWKSDSLGTAADIDLCDYHNNKKTFAGYYGQIIQKYREIEPKSRIFLMTLIPTEGLPQETIEKHRTLLYEIAAMFDFTYVLDFCQYAPPHDEQFHRFFYMGGHLNALGYLLTAQQVMSYIDFIIRNNVEDFTQTAFIGKGGVHNILGKW